MMKVAVSARQKALADFTFVTDIGDAQVSGLAGAHMKPSSPPRSRR
jgi:hypothetical protein